MDRPFTIIDCEQRSPEWRQARCGRITGTDADALLSKGKKGEESYQRRDLRIRKALERITGVVQDDDYQNRNMAYGVSREADARAAYEAARGVLVRQTGFIAHNTLPIGCSLDGDVDDCAGLVELKAPKSATHLSYLRAARTPKAQANPIIVIPVDYWRQLVHGLYVTGAQWADFVSFDDRLPDELQLLIVRVLRADVNIKAYDILLRNFLKEIDAEHDAILALKGQAA